MKRNPEIKISNVGQSVLPEQAERAAALIREAEFILIGAGAGVSAAAGLTYSGARFTDNFGGFLSFSHAGGKMGILVKAQHDQSLSATGAALIQADL